MISNQAAATQTLKVNQLMYKCSLVAITMAAGLCLAASRNKGMEFDLLCGLGAGLIPVTCAATRRSIRNARLKRTEEKLMRHTWTYLRSQESAAEPLVEAKPQPKLACGFRQRRVTPRAPAGEPVVFDAIAARARGSLAPGMPNPAIISYGDLCPAPTVLSEFECWRAEWRHPVIEYTGAVMEEIRNAAVEGYQRMRHGGIEVGGVLFGTHGKGGVRILAARPMACEYAQGPRFILSERDQTALAGQLAASRQDAELQGLEPVGWYHSHTRSEIFLSEQDVAYFNRFFPKPWQVALVVRPANLAPVRAGFFLREADGGLRTESSYREFQLAGPAPAVAAA
jgi:proteasome lid subunit RPN8/RPN11